MSLSRDHYLRSGKQKVNNFRVSKNCEYLIYHYNFLGVARYLLQIPKIRSQAIKRLLSSDFCFFSDNFWYFPSACFGRSLEPKTLIFYTLVRKGFFMTLQSESTIIIMQTRFSYNAHSGLVLIKCPFKSNILETGNGGA